MIKYILYVMLWWFVLLNLQAYGVTGSSTGNGMCFDSDLTQRVQPSTQTGAWVCDGVLYNADGTVYLDRTAGGYFDGNLGGGPSKWYILNNRYFIIVGEDRPGTDNYNYGVCVTDLLDRTNFCKTGYSSNHINRWNRILIDDGKVYYVMKNSSGYGTSLLINFDTETIVTDSYVPTTVEWDAFFTVKVTDRLFTDFTSGYKVKLSDVVTENYGVEYVKLEGGFTETGTLYSNTTAGIYPYTYFYSLVTQTGGLYGCMSVDGQSLGNSSGALVEGYAWDQDGDTFGYIGSYNFNAITEAGECRALHSEFFDNISKPEKFITDSDIIYYIDNSGYVYGYTGTGVSDLIYTAPYTPPPTGTGGVTDETFNWDTNQDGEVSIGEFFSGIGNTIKAFFVDLYNFFANLKALIEELMNIGTEEVKTFSFMPNTYASISDELVNTNPITEDSFLDRMYNFFKYFLMFLVLVITIFMINVITRKD